MKDGNSQQDLIRHIIRLLEEENRAYKVAVITVYKDHYFESIKRAEQSRDRAVYLLHKLEEESGNTRAGN